MERVARQMIDARVYPVTITTVPASNSILTPYRSSPTLPGQAPIPRPTTPMARPRARRSALPAVVVSLFLGAAVFGFTLGWLGAGLSSLISLLTTLTAMAAIYTLITLFGDGGHSGLHCPGAFHR